MVTNPRLARTTPDERREQILDVAAQVFVSEGYGAASMASIAIRVGGSKATLYKYFPSKEALFAAMLSRKCEAVMAPLRATVIESADVETYLAEFATRYLTALLDPEAIEVFLMIQADGVRFPEMSREFFAAGPEAVYGELSAAIAGFAERGLISCADPRLAAEQFLGAVRADVHMRATLGLLQAVDPADVARQCAHAARIFTRGLAASA